MPTEYEELVTALKATVIPFEEYGWKTRPKGTYGVITPEDEAGSMGGDGIKLDRAWGASIDVFFSKLEKRKTVILTVENVLRSVCGNCWGLNSTQYETQTGLFHIEWVCEVTGDILPDPEPEQENNQAAENQEEPNQSGEES